MRTERESKNTSDKNQDLGMRIRKSVKIWKSETALVFLRPGKCPTAPVVSQPFQWTCGLVGQPTVPPRGAARLSHLSTHGELTPTPRHPSTRNAAQCPC